MNTIKKVAAINDLSGASRCSLTVALPIISALGLQCMVMPTAILSNHTGYDEFFFEDYTEQMGEFADNWQKLGLNFDAIYTGFLGSGRQVGTVLRFIDEFKSANTKLIVDPVMGDNGMIYSTYTKELCDDMINLAMRADIVTPNITEACVLSGMEYDGETVSGERLKTMADKIGSLGAKSVIITGHRTCDRVSNFVYSQGRYKEFATPVVPKYFSGTGDVFASVITGLVTSGMDIFDAVEFASDFVHEATELSYKLGLDIKEGICFERLMLKLCDMGGQV